MDLPPIDSPEPDMEGMIGQWEHVAQLISVEYDGMKEEYGDEIHCRSLLEDNAALIAGPGFETYRDRIEAADELFRSVTTKDREWARSVFKEFWNPKRDWWYYRKPKRPGPHWGP